MKNMRISLPTKYFESGLPDFSWYNIPKRVEIYQITTKYTKRSYNIPKNSEYTTWPQNIQNGSKICIQNGGKIYQKTQNLPRGRKKWQNIVKYIK
jgi:hypothetical protein